MKSIFLSMTAVAIASVAAPAAAQYQQNHNQNYPGHFQNNGNAYGHEVMVRRIGELQSRLQDGLRNGSITRREASPIRQNIQRLTYAERQYSANGFTGQERASLQKRIRTISQQLRRADGGAQGRYAHWDREDQYEWNANSNVRVDANRDGWDDRDYNRNGRWDDDASYGYQQQQPGYGYQQQPAYGYQQQQPAPSTGIAGIIEGLFGGGGLQVGQRAPSNLYGVPAQYREQFRDGNGVYYRSDGRNIYQVDARSQTVVRIFRI